MEIINSTMKEKFPYEFLGIRQVRYFRPDECPEEKTIKSFISEAYSLTPSKQGLVPYKIHVFGPKNFNQKNALYKATKSREVEFQTTKNFQIFAPYVLLFTSRLCSNPNPLVCRAIARGQQYQSCDLNLYQKERKIPGIEIGMFCNNLSNICLSNGLNIAYTACLPNYINQNQPKFQALKNIKGEALYLSMSIGYADTDKLDQEIALRKDQYKPHTDEIIDWY
tara:strand:- start:3402 stop:4070 length:669 start_codon:yes stop_codon:yes gene_type:complete